MSSSSISSSSSLILLLFLPNFLFLLLLGRPLPHMIFSNTLIIESVPPGNGNVREELSAHFANLDTQTIDKLEEKLARAKEFVHRMEYGGRTFSDDNKLDRTKPVSISTAQPNISARMAQVLFEGDILLNERQISAILKHLERQQSHRHSQFPPKGHGHEEERVHTKRSLSADPDALWRRLPIKFRFNDSLELTAIQQIIEAIAYWENNTCVTFEPMDPEGPVGDREDFLEFFKGEGCYSMIGRFGGRQGVSIGVGCERAVGIVEHEIGHVLGLWHEQSRPDAEKYVQVDKEFVLPSYMADFQLRGSDEILTLDLPYDYGSVMHYGPTAFSSDGQSQTLITKNALFQSTIGQRDRLAFYDMMSINKAYCADKCGGITQLQSLTDQSGDNGTKSARAKCLNGGYPNPKRCGECICPSGYGGNRCEGAQRAKNAKCGGELMVGMDQWTRVESPGYDGDGYEPGQQCNWLVRSPPGTRVLAEFVDDFSLFCATICVDFVELKLSRDQRLTGARFCCDQRFPDQLISEHNQIAVLFRAQLSQDIGFRLRLRATQQKSTNQWMGKSGADRRTDKGGGQWTPIGGGGRKKLLPGKDIWGEWAPWGQCSRPCGGCGIRHRVRSCLSEQCADGQSQQFSACNFRACAVRPNCPKVLFLSRLCRSDPSDPLPLSEPTALLCSQVNRQLVECNQPSCCPPFYALNGQCVEEEAEQNQERSRDRGMGELGVI